MGVYWGYKLQKSTSHFAQSVFHFALMQLESLADLKHIPISFFTFKSIDQLPFEASNPIAIVKKGVRCELRRWEIGCGSCTKEETNQAFLVLRDLESLMFQTFCLRTS